ncbi:hypothetical protein Tco_0793758 [Tanacetum coccineum]
MAVVYDQLVCSGFKRWYLYWKDHGEVHEAAPLVIMILIPTNHIQNLSSYCQVLPVKESTVQKSALKKPGGIRHHTSVSTGDKSCVHDITINKSGVDHHTLGNKSAVHDTLSKSGTSYT